MQLCGYRLPLCDAILVNAGRERIGSREYALITESLSDQAAGAPPHEAVRSLSFESPAAAEIST